MSRVKGCINETCRAKHKEILFKEDDEFCPKCGQPLYFVCKSCHTKLSDGNEKYCVRCLAKKEDRKKNLGKAVGTATATVGAVATAAPKLVKDSKVIANAGKEAAKMGKEVINVVKNIKK